MATLKIVIFVGSVRTGRMAERVTKLVQKVFENYIVEPIFMDPVVLGPPAMELNQTPLHFYAHPNTDAPVWMKDIDTWIQQADGFVVITSEYNCGIPPALSNLMNTFPPASYRHRPVAIITYSTGNFGAVRVLGVLRPYLIELGMIVVPAYTTIPSVQTVVDEKGERMVGSGRYDGLLTKIDKVFGEMIWYAYAIKAQRAVIPIPV